MDAQCDQAQTIKPDYKVMILHAVAVALIVLMMCFMAVNEATIIKVNVIGCYE